MAVPAVAWAHPVLRRSFPAAFDTLSTAPFELRLVFNEPIELRFARVELAGPDGTSRILTGVTVVPDSLRILRAPVPAQMGPGSYTVRWQAAGDDGHAVRGAFTFTVLADSGAAPGDRLSGAFRPPPPQSSPAAFDAGSPGFVAIRWMMYLGLLGVIGAIVFQSFVLRRLRRGGREASKLVAGTLGAPVARFGRVAAGVFLISLPARLLAQTASLRGSEPWDTGLPLELTGHTIWGWSWIAQLLLGIAVFVGFRGAVRGTARWDWIRMCGLLLALTPAFAGHAIAAERWIPVAVVADGLHILGAAGWLGTLAVLLSVGLANALRLPEPERGPVAADMVNAFSPVALGFAGMVLATGVLSALIHTGRIPDLWESGYGKMLLLKLGILSIVAATGAWNWRRVRPVMGDELGARRIRKSGSVEVAVALVVLLVTAVLVALPTPLAARAP